MMKIAIVLITTLMISVSVARADGLSDANAGLDALNHGDYSRAVMLFTRAIKIGKLSPADKELAYVKRAQAFLGEKRADLALADLDKAQALDPKDSDIAALRAQAQPGSGQEDACHEPPAPGDVDGTTASQQQMKDAIQNFQLFQTASDAYQRCLVSDLKAQQAAAASANPPATPDPSVTADANARINANQQLKERVGQSLNAAIAAYKAIHPD
jgi:tetratricopeptide (TPR) repeat protein